MSSDPLPFAGLKVVDCGSYIAAPAAATVLADLAGGRAALDQPVASALRDEFTRGVGALGSPEVATAVGADRG